MTETWTAGWTITEMEQRTAHSYLAGDRAGVYARVTLADGSSLELSRLAGETSWTADASWGPGSFPRWCNGFGARYLITKYVTDSVLVAALDKAAADLASPAGWHFCYGASCAACKQA